MSDEVLGRAILHFMLADFGYLSIADRWCSSIDKGCGVAPERRCWAFGIIASRYMLCGILPKELGASPYFVFIDRKGSH